MDAIYARIYANLVANKLKTIKEVPLHLQAAVIALLQ